MTAAGRVIGIVPAAGHATRLQPLPCSKEVYPIGGRPVMDYLLVRLARAGCGSVRVVTRPEKEDLIAHAKRRGAEVVLGRPRSVSESLLLGVNGLQAEDVILFGFPDTIWDPSDGFLRLLGALQEHTDLALGLFRASEPARCDVALVDSCGEQLAGVMVKPERPPSDWIWACAAGRMRVLGGLRHHREPGVYFNELCRRQRVAAVRLSGPFLDVGTPEALATALVRWPPLSA